MDTFSAIKDLLMQKIQCLEDNKQNYVKRPGIDFTRKRKLSFSDTILAVLSMSGSSIRGELLEYFAFSSQTPTASAFVQQRAKLKTEAFRSLFYDFSSALPSSRQTKYHFLAVDGSEVLIPLEGENEAYGYFHRETQKQYHQIHLSAVYDLEDRRYLAAFIEPRKGHNERTALHQLLEDHVFPENSVFICDRGYEGYPLLAHISRKGQYFVIRAKDRNPGGILKGMDLPETGEFDVLFDKICVNGITKNLVRYPDQYHRVHATHTPYFLNRDVKEYRLTFRIVRLRLKTGEYECLLTNLPANEFDLPALKEIYHRRWGIETSFRHLKHSIGLLYFHSKKIESIEQEIWARLILYNFCMAVVQRIEKRKSRSRYPTELNTANAIRVCRRFLRIHSRESPSECEQLISGELLPVRAERNSPRKKATQSPRKFNFRVC